MRIVFSRKGFDQGAGGGPSPILPGRDGTGAEGGRPVSLPIPDTKGLSATTYADLGLGELAHAASGGRYRDDSLCHHDPMFLPDGSVHLGQCHTSQGHLAKQGVGVGDVFLFFGWFRGGGHGDHHRIFGYMRVTQTTDMATMRDDGRDRFLALKHPHALGMHGGNDMIYSGQGRLAQTAPDILSLTDPGYPRSVWRRPAWLEPGTLSYFGSGAANWPPGQLTRVGNGQEFVTDIGARREPRAWLDRVIGAIEAGQP